MLDRAVKESFAIRCRVIDLDEVERFFSSDGHLHCAYCDVADAERWDHLHPVSQGGDTVPGNLVPACRRCDDSKQDRTIEEWALSMSTHRPQQEKLAAIQERLKSYRERFAYHPRQFEQKLNAQQRVAYERFREKLHELRELLREHSLVK